MTFSGVLLDDFMIFIAGFLCRDSREGVGAPVRERSTLARGHDEAGEEQNHRAERGTGAWLLIPNLLICDSPGIPMALRM